MMPIVFFLGLCSGYVQDDPELTSYLCEAEIASKSRVVKVEDEWTSFDYVYFHWEVSQVVWP